MAYLITDASGEIRIEEQGRDTSTSLVLVGKFYPDWGEHYAQNFLSLMSSFASDGVNKPARPRIGQLWFDTGDKKLNVHIGNSVWKVVGDDLPDRLANPRMITLAGNVNGSTLFDGSQNVTIDTELEVIPGVAGVYVSADITIDQYGRVVSAQDGAGGDPGDTEVESFTVRNPQNQDRPTQIGAVVFTRADVVHALGYTPYDSANPANYSPATTPQDLSGFLLLNGSRPMIGALNMGNKEIVNVSAPQAATSAVRKVDLDNVNNNKTLRKFQGANSLEYNVTVSTAAPSGGQNGDVWYRY